MSDKEVALTMPFALDSLGNIQVTSDQSVIWSNRVRMAVGTILGERVMRPNYGSKIPDQAMGTVSFMSETIEKDIARVFSEQLNLLTLSSVTFTHDEVTNKLTAEVFYKLPNREQSSALVGLVTVSNTNPTYEELA